MVAVRYAWIGIQLVALNFSASDVRGQTGKLFTVGSELSSSMVIDIHQDRSGYIWIATEDGLNKFDGTNFTIYKQNPQEANSMLNNIVRVISEDAYGKMYIGYINGLQYHDPATKEFHTIPFILQGGITIDAHVMTICQRKNGQLLVGTSGYGLFEVLFDQGRWYCSQVAVGIPSDMIIKIVEDTKERLWVSTEDQGLFLLEGNTSKNYFASKEVQNNVISSIVEDEHGGLWVGSLNNGLFKYDASADTFCRTPSCDDADLPISDLIVSAANTIYVATDGRGVKYVDPAVGELVDLDLPIATFNHAKSKMKSILEDRDGNIWMGLYQKGVFMMPAHKHRFGYIGYKSINKNLIGSNSVMAIWEDRRGELWVGSDNDGLYRVGPGLTTSKHYANEGQAPGTIMAIFEDSKGHLWVGSYLEGLARFDRESGRFSYPVILKDKKNANVQRVFRIAEDAYQRLWLATMGSGLFRLDLHSYEVKRYATEEKTKFKPQSNCIPNDWINCVSVSRDNKLYFGTYDGLGCLDLETESFVSVFGRNRLFGDVVIYALYDDDQGNLWLGTSKGLKRLKIPSLEVSEFGVEDGLPSNIVWSVEGDRHGDIWLSTNRGISKLDVRRKQFLNFHAGDGLQGDEFMRGVSLKSSDGKLFFGGLHGISYFNPDEIHIQRKVLAVQVVDLYIHGKAVRKGMKSGRFNIIDTAINQASAFHLAHHDNSFTIEFSTMDFSDSERVVFQYSMNGNAWISLPTSSNRITFDNLMSGTHRLLVRATAANASSDIKAVTLVIHPVWYLSASAKACYIVLALLLGYGILTAVKSRRRIRHQMRAHRRKEEINEAKLQLFVNIAHEIRTPLTLIASPLKRLKHMDSHPEGGYLYRIMDRNVRRMLDLVNQMLDVQKIEKGLMTLKCTQIDMVRYTQEVCALFEEEFSAKAIHFSIKLPDQACFARIDPRNFDKVLVNVLSNACRFTPSGGWIAVELCRTGHDRSGELLTLSVADSGPQINEQDIDRIFDCFYQSDTHRDHNNSGTGIGLYLAKQLIALHGGTIRAENLKEGGCRFVITMPLAKSGEVLNDGLAQVSRKLTEPYIAPVAPAPPRLKNGKPKRVLVVDDDSDIVAYLTKSLSHAFAVSAYSDGLSAYKHILSEPPDLVISDVMMPELDGFSLCEKIRNNPNISHIPIILLTAKAQEADNLDGLERGADAYMTKPFNTELLLKAITSIIKNRELIRKSEREQRFQEEYIPALSIKSADEKLLEKIHQLIEHNLNNPLLSVEMISAEIGISRVHLHRKLKQLTNMTTRDLVRNIRLKQAARLIEKKGLSVSEVAYAVGYSDLSNFSLSFKQMYGVSPTAYAAQKTGK
nr:two-component regulator propeller domain-containing protein [Parapedobacter sp. ISTM3]